MSSTSRFSTSRLKRSTTKVVAGLAATAAVTAAGIAGATPAQAAATTTFSDGSFGLMMCRYDWNPYYVRVGVQNYSSSPITEVSAYNTSAGWSGVYVDNIPGWYGAKWMYWAQGIDNGWYEVYRTYGDGSSSYRGGFWLDKDSLPYCGW